MVIKQRLSIEEFLALPEEDASLEYVDGEIVEKVPPKFKHSRSQKFFLLFFENSSVATQFEAVPEARFLFGEPARGYIPDVAIVRRNRLTRDDSGEVADDQWLAPDIAIEILSPGQGAGRLIEKLTFYMANGVLLALVVDNQRHQVSVYRQGEEARTLAVGEQIDLMPAIPGLVLEVATIFAFLKD
jgi:Uma2 family endonuclease